MRACRPSRTAVRRPTRRWWIVNDRGTVDLCPTDPGFPVDLYITTDIRTMVRVWVGKLALGKAISSERMEVIGPRQLRDRLGAWFLYSPINMNGLSSPLLPSPRENSRTGRKPTEPVGSSV